MFIKYFPDKKRGQNQQDCHVHPHDDVKWVLEVVGHVAGDYHENGGQECRQNEAEESPLYHKL